ncbi:MAG: flavin reductase family protein [Flammeovirgaceae bacterium]
MKIIDPKETSNRELFGHMLGAIGPRPIAFASTVNKAGEVNLSPFSFFNAFSSNPPILVFSPSRSGRDGTLKNTLENIYEVPEVVISTVHYGIVEQASLSSTAYAKGINEFVKAGFTELPAQLVKPPRVKEAHVHFECKVNDVVVLGDQGGAGHLVICEVLLMHINEEILDQNGKVDPFKIDLVGRMGGDWYCRAQGEALFEVEKPITKLGIGIDQLPAEIRTSPVLTGNNLGKLANVEAIPTAEELANITLSPSTQMSHESAKELLDHGHILEAWKVLLG